MSQYNLGSLSSNNNAIQVVAAGDPPTLILNHSTKNSIYIGESNSVGTGNLLDATPLDPYASIVMNGQANVFAVAVDPTQPATVYTYQNAINWTPKAIQPNIVDGHSPFVLNPPNATVTLDVPPTAQGLFLASNQMPLVTDILIVGVQSGIVYYDANPNATSTRDLWVPILSDADTSVTVEIFTGINTSVSLVWIMDNFVSGLVRTGQIADVNIAQITAGTIPVSVPNPLPTTVVNTPNVTATISGTPNVSVTNAPTVVPSFSHIDDRSLAANQVPLSFNVSLAAGATTTLLPASVGVQYFLHDLWCQINSGNMLSFHIQDTMPTDLGVFINIVSGTPANAYRPPNTPFDFKGAPVASGLGVILKNGGATTEAFVGCLTYSK